MSFCEKIINGGYCYQPAQLWAVPNDTTDMGWHKYYRCPAHLAELIVGEFDARLLPGQHVLDEHGEDLAVVYGTCRLVYHCDHRSAMGAVCGLPALAYHRYDARREFWFRCPFHLQDVPEGLILNSECLGPVRILDDDD